jgi:hypothetical protein
MAGSHPIDAQLDQLLAPEGQIVAKPGQSVGAAPHPTDQLLDKMLTPVQEPGELEQSLGLKYDPSKEWDTARQALDSATFGVITKGDDKLTKAKAAWEKANGPAAVAADFVGSSAPSVVLSTLAGQGVFRAGQLATKLAGNPFFEEAARFLTGQAAGGRMLRLGSQATWGAGQGTMTGAYNRYMGQNDDLTSEALLGAGAGPVSNMLFAPYRSNVAPEIGQLARDWSKQNLGLSAAQLPGAPPLLRAISKALNLGKSDMKDVTSSLMRSTGSADTALTAANLDAARGAIKSSLAKNVHPAWANIGDSDLPQKFEDALNSGVLTPSQAQAVRLAQNQWANSRVLDRVAANSVGTPGVADPKALVSAMRSAQYPGGMSAGTAAAGSGNPVDLDTLARGSQLFVPPGSTGHGGGLTAALGVAGGALGAEGLGHAMPFLEQVMPHLPLLAHGATAYGAINAAAAPLALPFMASPAYRYLLTHGGVGPVANPLLPSIVSNPDYQSKVDWMKNYFAPVTPAQGGQTQSDPTEDYIRRAAAQRGIDPDVAVKVAKTEGLGGGYAGDQGSSFGPFQLHYGNVAKGQNAVSGLGDLFTQKTGLHASDPKTVPQQVDFALDYAARNGWSPWHGWTGDEFAGITKSARRITIPLSAANVAPNIAPDVNALSQALGSPVGQGGVSSNELTGSP